MTSHTGRTSSSSSRVRGLTEGRRETKTNGSRLSQQARRHGNKQPCNITCPARRETYRTKKKKKKAFSCKGTEEGTAEAGTRPTRFTRLWPQSCYTHPIDRPINTRPCPHGLLPLYSGVYHETHTRGEHPVTVFYQRRTATDIIRDGLLSPSKKQKQKSVLQFPTLSRVPLFCMRLLRSSVFFSP